MKSKTNRRKNWKLVLTISPQKLSTLWPIYDPEVGCFQWFLPGKTYMHTLGKNVALLWKRHHRLWAGRVRPRRPLWVVVVAVAAPLRLLELQGVQLPLSRWSCCCSSYYASRMRCTRCFGDTGTRGVGMNNWVTFHSYILSSPVITESSPSINIPLLPPFSPRLWTRCL